MMGVSPAAVHPAGMRRGAGTRPARDVSDPLSAVFDLYQANARSLSGVPQALRREALTHIRGRLDGLKGQIGKASIQSRGRLMAQERWLTRWMALLGQR